MRPRQESASSSPEVPLRITAPIVAVTAMEESLVSRKVMEIPLISRPVPIVRTLVGRPQRPSEESPAKNAAKAISEVLVTESQSSCTIQFTFMS